MTAEQAYQKIKTYCAYQERCHQEVKDKLYGFGLHRAEAETLLSRLIEENYLDEERFAIQFAGGKFRMKRWGKQKIDHELKVRGVSNYCRKKALAQIPDDDYQKALEKLVRERLRQVGGRAERGRGQTAARFAHAKAMAYFMQKGYEADLVRQTLTRVGSE